MTVQVKETYCTSKREERERERERERRNKDVHTKIDLAIFGDSLEDDVSLIDEARVRIL
jgi:hypothetical protein